MDELQSLEAEQRRLVRDTNRLLDRVRAAGRVSSTAAAAGALASLREAVCEDLNQIQHEILILDAARWLRKNVLSGRQAQWQWNPRQRGGKDEPDLMCRSGEQLIVAEVTASKAPVGVIDSRMRTTLAKLVDMEGERYCFVRTEAMRKRAETKVAKEGWSVHVVQLP